MSDIIIFFVIPWGVAVTIDKLLKRIEWIDDKSKAVIMGVIRLIVVVSALIGTIRAFRYSVIGVQ